MKIKVAVGLSKKNYQDILQTMNDSDQVTEVYPISCDHVRL